MKWSVQTLMVKFKPVFIQKAELGYRDMSLQITFKPFLAVEDSDSNKGNNFLDFQKHEVFGK